MALWYATKCGVTSHNISTGLLGIFQALNIGSGTPKNFSGVALSYQPLVLHCESSLLILAWNKEVIQAHGTVDFIDTDIFASAHQAT